MLSGPWLGREEEWRREGRELGREGRVTPYRLGRGQLRHIAARGRAGRGDLRGGAEPAFPGCAKLADDFLGRDLDRAFD